MLVLGVHVGARAIIECPGGEVISVWVTNIRSDRVELGFDAPLDYTIDREKVHRARRGGLEHPAIEPVGNA